jgi:hypothetical protein
MDPEPTENPGTKFALPAEVIAGIVIGCAIFVGVIVIVSVILYQYYSLKRLRRASSVSIAPAPAGEGIVVFGRKLARFKKLFPRTFL